MTEWISHRGYCSTASENTAEAFRAAQSVGFHHIETDLRLTADGHIVLCHDPDLSRVSGQPVNVSSSTREQLLEVRLNRGERLFFLDELLDQFKNLQWTFDFKEQQNPSILHIFSELIALKGMQEWIVTNVTFLAWDLALENDLRKRYSSARFYARLEECKRAGIAHLLHLGFLSGVKPSKIYSLASRFKGVPLFRSELVNRYHHQGARVLAFLPETQEEAKAALKAGFDQILSDHPPISD